jgi:2-polyprenyl-3-methyl-5-hydroxy-6-metoxy-1,4-benzoquinol methylase
MDAKEIDILGDQISDHWYYIAKSRALIQFLDGYRVNEILDVGAGSGFFAKELMRAGICNRALCVDTAYVADQAQLYRDKPLIFVRRVDGVTQDLILMMDVIEHVVDDVGFIRSYTDGMPRGGTLLITVPAFQFLWSGHDVFLEHKRRYTLSSLRRTVEAAGLEVVRGRYFFLILFPIICAIRFWKRARLMFSRSAPGSDLRVHSAQTNVVLTAIHEFERRTLFHCNRFAGLSIFCLAKKP